MSEQLYRVCWRHYLANGGTSHWRSSGGIPLGWAMDQLYRWRLLDARRGWAFDYWLEPI